MEYEIEMTENLQHEISSVPGRVRKKLLKEGYAWLRSAPAIPNPPAIKKLSGWNDFYRLRLNDYRAIYHVNQESKTVTLLFVGPRGKVYEQLGHDPEKDQPTVRIIADEQVHRLLERQPEQEEFTKAYQQALNEPPPAEPEGTDDAPLPTSFGSDLLDSLDIPSRYHQVLLTCKTEGDLLYCDIPDKTKQKILNSLWPDPIERVIDAPKRKVGSGEALEELAKGSRSLESFLLALDDTQKPLTNRFNTDSPKGPWIVKGGPGSGKSTVALYCIRNLLRGHQSQLRLEMKPLRILLTTYAKSLVKASEHLLKALGVDCSHGQVDITNIDKLVWDYLPEDWKRRKLVLSGKETTDELIRTVIKTCSNNDKLFDFNTRDKDFLFEELNTVIVGNGILSPQQYASFERTGRVRRLSQNQRKQVWDFWIAFEKELKDRELCTLSQRFVAATKSVTPTYDYVFIDEAQDIAPVALRMCVRLAVDPKNIFVTADRNQSIYSSGFSWKRIQEDLDFRGRSTILQRNYRTTHEIIDAIRHILAKDDQVDDETLNDQPVRHGNMPELCFASEAEETSVLKEWLTHSLLKERVGCENAAILCPTNDYCNRIARNLPREFNARAMKSNDVNINHPGIKVMTMHAAKGLQFPLVAVVGLTRGRMPWNVGDGDDQEEIEQRLRRTFFVACSRAMQRLLVIGDRSQPSPFLKGFDEKHWDIS